MGAARPRRALARMAQDADLGAVRRVHRQRHGVAVAARKPWTVFLLVAGGLLAGAPGHLRLIASVLALALGEAAALVYQLPVGGSSGRRWYAVCDGGVLIWSRQSADAIALPWDTRVKVTPVGHGAHRVVFALSWADDDGPHTHTIRTVGGRAALIEAIKCRAPRPTRSLRRAAAGAVDAAALAVAVWTARCRR